MNLHSHIVDQNLLVKSSWGKFQTLAHVCSQKCGNFISAFWANVTIVAHNAEIKFPHCGQMFRSCSLWGSGIFLIAFLLVSFRLQYGNVFFRLDHSESANKLFHSKHSHNRFSSFFWKSGGIWRWKTSISNSKSHSVDNDQISPWYKRGQKSLYKL